MSETAALPHTRPKRRHWLSLMLRQKTVRIGCLPATLLLAGLVLAFFNAVSFTNVPYWVASPRPYVIGGRLVLSGGVLIGLQAVGTWVLGLIAASKGGNAVSGRGELLQQRLIISRRRMSFLAWAVILLRLGVVVVLIMAAIYAFTPLLGRPLRWDTTTFVRAVFRSWPLPVALTIAVVLTHWLIGPLLRMRYSTALGALAATWAKQPADRSLLALTARLGAELAGYLAIVWGGGLIWLIVLTIMDPSYYSVSRFAGRPSTLSPSSPEVLTACLIIGVLALVIMAGQIFLPQVYVRMARRRLRRTALRETLASAS
jgi:hypothetical protein